MPADDRAFGQTFLLGHPDPATTADILRALADGFDRPYRPWRVPDFALNAAAWAGDLSWVLGRQPLVDGQRLAELRAEGFVCSADRIREALGFTAGTGLRQGVARTAQWYRNQGWV